MKIIGHRGAAGLALENSLESILIAINTGVDGVEFDVRLTADDKFVLCHDRSTQQVAKQNKVVRDTPIMVLKKVQLLNNEYFPSVEQAIKACGTVPIYIETKDSDWANALSSVVKALPPGRQRLMNVIAFDHDELARFKSLCPGTGTYALEHTKSLEVIAKSRARNFTGIDINFWLLNPLSYLLALHYNLQILVYTVDSPLLARFLRLLYPKIMITTNLPHKMQFLRSSRTK